LLTTLALILSACGGRGPANPAPTATYSPQATTAAGLVAEGDERLALSDLAGAERAYQSAIEADASFAPAYAHLAYVHLFNPETRPQALADAEKAVEIAPDSAEAWAYLSRARDWNGDFETAREAGEKAVELDPNSADAHSFLGEVYTDLRMYAEAEETAGRAVALDPNNAEAHRNLGYYYTAVSRHEDALAEWQAAYDLQPQFSHRLTSIALYYLYLRPDEQTARQWLTDALALAPDDTLALQFLARLDSSFGDTQAALAGCERVLALAPNSPDGHNCQAIVLADSGDYEEAEAARLKAIEADPGDESGYTGLGYVYFATGDCRKATAQFEKAIELSPRSGQNHASLGLARLCAGATDEAIDGYEQAIELEPFNGDHHIGLGQIYLQQGDFNRAEREMQAAIKIDPASAQYVTWLGRVYAAQGDVDKAIAQYEQALALDPDDGDNATTLGFAYLEKGDFEVAAESFRQALDLFEQHIAPPASVAQATYGLGLTQVALNDCAGAVPALQAALELNPQLTDALGYLGACRRSLGLTDTPLPAALTQSGPLNTDNALVVLDESLPALGVQAQTGYDQVNGQTALVILYAATVPPSDPAFVVEQSPVVYAGSWALARLLNPVDGLIVVALGPNGEQLNAVAVRREHAQWWTQGIIDDDAFASLWFLNG
jgi:tetratricopeptide (TPR) repeat protein